MQNQTLAWDTALLKRYEQAGPRYTSYPTAVQFSENFDENELDLALIRLKPKFSSLYLHIPFCQSLCYYCGCHKIVTKNKALSERYIEALLSEIRLKSPALKESTVHQMHWGGGTPTFIGLDNLEGIFSLLGEHFMLSKEADRDFSIELDPRFIKEEDLFRLQSLGFNRISFGVQDLNPIVQKAINRLQSEEQTQKMIDAARKACVSSINIDLIYGLPKQTLNTFVVTLEKIITLSPDRISLYHYAHLPNRFKPQNGFDPNTLPSSSEKLKILEYAIHRLQNAGFVYIGMDHFAKANDSLTKAQKTGHLHRNFQGYSIYKDLPLIGLGASAISQVGDVYAQNEIDLNPYEIKIAQKKWPTYKGYVRTLDDKIRNQVILSLICHFKVDYSAMEKRFNISFENYFFQEMQTLESFKADGLILQDDGVLSVTPLGRLLIRNICTVFDKYYKGQSTQNVFSKML